MTLLPAQHWAHNFSLGAEDIDCITNLLLEKERPLSSIELAKEIIRQRERKAQELLKRQFDGTKTYRPSDSYAVGDRLTFSLMDHRAGTVLGLRDGQGSGAESFRVAVVEFDDDGSDSDGRPREFAVEYDGEHPLNHQAERQRPSLAENHLTLEDIVNAPGVSIVGQVNDALENNADLLRIAGTWFLREWMVDVHIGYLHLAEAILEECGGGPMTPREILRQIGGLGDAPKALQEFSLNYAMNQDERFDEVGPAGQILWHLTRLLPRMVRQVPKILQYNPIPYDRGLLAKEMLQLEYDLDDEHSPIDSPRPDEEVCITLIYPHRRVGTLPINSETRYVFPGSKTQRIAITVVDALDKEEYPCWVVHKFKYVYGLSALYQKHHLPVGAYVYLSRTNDPARFEIEFDSYRPRTEWIPLAHGAEKGHLRFQPAKRAIGADYDDMIIVGVSNLQEVDKLGKDAQNSRRPLAVILRNLITEHSRQNPQKTVHAKVLYSTLNMLRRCPPGPIFSTLVANPEFEYVGGNYWKLSE